MDVSISTKLLIKNINFVIWIFKVQRQIYLNVSNKCFKQECFRKTYQGLTLSIGIGKQVKNTVKRRNDFLPQTSDNAPIRGALRNDRRP